MPTPQDRFGRFLRWYGGKDVFPVGIRVGRGRGSKPVLHKDTLIVSTTGEADAFHVEKVNISMAKVRVRSWWQK